MDYYEACSHCGAVVCGPEPRPYRSACPRCGARSSWRLATPDEADAFRKGEAWRRRIEKAERRRAEGDGALDSPLGRRLSILLFVAIVLGTCFGPVEEEEDD
jgi:hypothetical protein